MRVAAAVPLLLLALGCRQANGPDSLPPRAALDSILADGRRAHLETDPDLLVRSLDDTLVSLDAGVVSAQPRDSVRAMFARYFDQARYYAWEDVVPPRIAVAVDHSLATVARVVCVDREEPDEQGGRRRRVFVSAYSASYLWREGGWRMATVTSTFLPNPPARCPSTRTAGAGERADPVARSLLAAMRRSLGAPERVQSLSAVAAVTGPRGRFGSTVYSARDGRARLALGTGFLAGIGAQGGWLAASPGDPVGPLDSVSRTVVRGHELHMLALVPETRWRHARYAGIQPWADDSALTLSFEDELGAPALLYLGRRDTLPVGLRLVNHTGEGTREVVVTFARWRAVDGVRLFGQAVFHHGADRYLYDYTELRLNAVPDALFEAPWPTSPLPRRPRRHSAGPPG